MTKANEIASFIFCLENDDPNEELSSEEHTRMISEAEKVLLGIEYLFANLLQAENTAVDIQTIFYDAGKKTFGEDKKELFRFFNLLYLILFERPQGPRWGNFVLLYGKQEFLDFLRSRIENPFGFPWRM